MKKVFLSILLFCLLSIILIPVLINAKECPPPSNPPPIYIVHCGQYASCPCEIQDFFVMLARIYDFIVWWLVTPLAILMLTIGGVMIMISAGNPNLASKGKQIVWISIIGLVLVFCSWLIIDWILGAMGYSLGTWWKL